MTSLTKRKYDKDTEIEKATVTITSQHHEIHAGNAFSAVISDGSVDIASPKYVRITAPNSTKRVHLHYEVTADAGYTMELYENPTLNAAGTAVAIINKDRNSSKTSDVTVTQDATTQAPNNDGTLLESHIGGSSGFFSQTAGSSESRRELVLKQGEDYIIKITVTGNGTAVTIGLSWYEI
jgi:uncharacterized membrane protein (UPF0182 family)